jgi:hypothetical protein
MRLHLERPAVVCTAALSLLTVVAAVAPATARADDTLPTQLPSVASLVDATTSAAADAVAAAELPAATVDDGAVPALDPAAAAEGSETSSVDAPVPAPVGDTATPSAPQSPDAATQATPTGDITLTNADTAVDTPAGPSQPAQPKPSVAPAPAPLAAPATANINVSVRIDSPGDNGPVSQVNVAGAAVAPLSTATAPEKTPSTPPPSGASSAGGATSPAAVAEDVPGTWYWNWDCLGTAPVSAISPAGSGSGSFPSSWTWIWNCGNNSAQYQSETQAGYQQINTNIAIRFASPGNDGPVTQVNVGAGISIPLPTAVHDAPFPPSPVSLPPPLDTTLGVVSAAVGPVIAAPTPVDTSDITTAPGAFEPSDASTAPVSATPVAAPVAQGGGLTSGRGPLDRQAGGSRRFVLPPASVGRIFTPSPGSADAAWQSTSPAPAASSSERAPARPPEVSPTPPPHHLPGKSSVRSDSVLSATAAASGVGGSSGSGGLPLLLALPFVAALLDLARRVALEHATWPSGHRRRAPDRPG